MLIDDVCSLAIGEQSALIAKRELSPIELTAACLRRVERLEPSLGCFLRRTPERALADARRAESELASGTRRGPLHGIPIGLKDLIDTAGIATTANSRVLSDRVPARDAAVARRLREAGTVLFGKLQMTEFATGKAYRDDPVPQPRNPWDAGRSPGGSSSGSAVAVSAGLVGAAIGSDTGGSIRAPAAWSGVVGLKPTFGLVSTEGVIALSWSLDHVGPLTRSVSDAALVLQAIAGSDTDGSGSRDDRPDYSAQLGDPVAGLRIGVPRAFLESLDPIEPAVRTSFDDALRVFRDLRAVLVDVELPEFDAIQAAFLAICGAESVAFHGRWLRTARGLYGRGTWERLMQGLLYSGAEYVDAQRLRKVIARSVATTQRAVDVIATPAMPRTAPTIDEYESAAPLPRTPFLDLANLVGAPAISIPCGFDGRGLPIGLNLMGRPYDEAAVLRTAAAFERATPWHERRPPLDVLSAPLTVVRNRSGSDRARRGSCRPGG